MKAMATVGQIEKVLYRALSLTQRDTPEGKLLLAVIVQAVEDGRKRINRNRNESKDARIFRKDAERFLMQEQGSTLICELLGLNPDWVRELLQDHFFSFQEDDKPRFETDDENILFFGNIAKMAEARC